MNLPTKSIRTFIGAKNFNHSREFYSYLGFQEIEVGKNLSYFQINENQGFYLQDYYVKKWIDNSMVFLEVQNTSEWHEYLHSLNLNEKFPKVRLSTIKTEDWGKEFFLHDPDGVLWHIGEFY